jgi:hypothetical protein
MTDEINFKPWTTEHLRKYKWLYSYLILEHPEAGEQTYIDTHLKFLEDIIINNKNWGDESKKQIFFMIGRYLYNIQNKKADKYLKLGVQYSKKIENMEIENEFDEKENINFREQNYFLDIISSINYKKIQTQEDNQKYLLLCLLVLQPPLRSSIYSNCKIINLKKNNNNVDNYIVINKNTTEFIINNDKASNYDIYKKNKSLKYINITNKELIKILRYSVSKYPRLYLLEIDKHPISHPTLLLWLRQITAIENINFEMLYSVFLLDVY